jgi:hypothetical protein
MALNQILKCGKACTVVLQSSSYNTAVTDSGGGNVLDLATNPAYVLVQVTGSSPSGSGVILPQIEGNYAVVNNKCGTAISVQCSIADVTSNVTINNNEVATVWFNGSVYVKTTSTTTALNISAYPADTTPADANILLLQAAGSLYQMSLSTLKSYLGIAASSQSKLLPAVKWLYTNSITQSATPANQDGAVPAAGDRALCVAQPTATQNGVFIVASGAWPRAADMAIGANAADTLIEVSASASGHGGSVWRCTSIPGSDIVNTNNLVFSPYMLNFDAVYGSDIQADSVNKANPKVVYISGDSTGTTHDQTNKMVQVAKTFANRIVAANTLDQIIRETVIDYGGDVEWKHYNNVYGRACKRGELAISDEIVVPSVGTGVTVNLFNFDSFWKVHSGKITVHIHDTNTGKDFSKTMPFSAIYGKRFKLSDGNGSIANSGISSDVNNSGWSGSDVSAPSQSQGQGVWAGGTEPTIAIMPTTWINQYYLMITFGAYTGGPSSFDIMITADIICMDSAVMQN